MSKKIGVLLNIHGKGLTESASELLALAVDLNRQLKGQLVAVVGNLGQMSEAALKALPVDTVYYSPEPCLSCDLAKAINQLQEFDLFLTSMDVEGREVGAYIALLAYTEYVGAISGIKNIGQSYELTRLVAEGLSQETKKYPQADKLVLGLVPGLWGKKPILDGGAEIKELSVEKSLGQQIVKEYLADWQEIGVEEADIVVAGGNGLHNQEVFNSLQSLGQALSAPIGGSRVAEDKGWIAHHKMIGATGKTIAPEVYIACGISGAIQHLVGVGGAKRVISINTDPMCGMMNNADLALVGDAQEVVSALTKALQAYKLKEEV